MILKCLKQLFCHHNYKIVHQFGDDYFFKCNKCQKLKIKKFTRDLESCNDDVFVFMNFLRRTNLMDNALEARRKHNSFQETYVYKMKVDNFRFLGADVTIVLTFNKNKTDDRRL